MQYDGEPLATFIETTRLLRANLVVHHFTDNLLSPIIASMSIGSKKKAL